MSPAACAELLKQHFPALFGGPAKPLKLRIQIDIQERAPGVFTKGALSAFFRRHTGSTGYLMALGKSTQRFDLDGNPAGELSEEHRQLARDELTRRRQVTREREQQAHAQANAQARALEQAQQAQHAEVMQARQARLALLRDFERTTLTPANFCALKGVAPDALEATLAQARQEAAEAPPPRPADDRRGPAGARRDGAPGPRREGAPAPHHDGRGDNHNAPRNDNRNDNRRDGQPAPRQDQREAQPGRRPAGGPGGRRGNR